MKPSYHSAERAWRTVTLLAAVLLIGMLLALLFAVVAPLFGQMLTVTDVQWLTQQAHAESDSSEPSWVVVQFGEQAWVRVQLMFALADDRLSHYGAYTVLGNSLLMALLVSVIAAPMLTGYALLVHLYKNTNRWLDRVDQMIDALTDIPSLVYGVYFVLLMWCVHWVWPEAQLVTWSSLLVLLLLVVIPKYLVVIQRRLRSVSAAQEEGLIALGATHYELFQVLYIKPLLGSLVTGGFQATTRILTVVAPLLLLNLHHVPLHQQPSVINEPSLQPLLNMGTWLFQRLYQSGLQAGEFTFDVILMTAFFLLVLTAVRLVQNAVEWLMLKLM